ncbi:GNAT family N-acetyltransferase [Ferrovibrio xuzhouensis]|uniref:GNAT family N-acetyltransferase n=1 Tax=Ferrovibrio xuzhouensis TaxID=1576914 RepID=A0ABV7VFR2_9PROT
MENIGLRPYAPSDAAAVRDLHTAAFRALAAGHHSVAQIAAHEALILAPDYAEDLARSHVLLALHDTFGLAATAGWLAMPGRPDTARIRKVFVHPALARRGLASTMVRAAEAAARAAGRPHLFVRANLNAVPLYEKLGYRPLEPGLMPAGGENLPVLYMEKRAVAG